jgi:hypothetical protein
MTKRAKQPAAPQNFPELESGISTDGRRRQVAEAAYFKAQQRGFAPGSEQTDWFEAEREIESRDRGER